MVLMLACAIGAPMMGCAGRRGSSFETLGIPQPEDRPGTSPVVFGWAREQREGWVIRGVRVDERSQSEWNDETQRPTIFYLEPGVREFRVSAVQLRDPGDPNSRPRRRYRIRPFRLGLEEGIAQVCVVRVEGDQRQRPRVRCEAQEPEPTYDEADQAYDEYGDEYAEDDEIRDEAPVDEDEEPPTVAAATPPPAPRPPSAEAGEVPSPFDPPAAPAARPPTAAPEPTPVAPPAPVAAPASATEPPQSRPRVLTVEERVERLERQLEELRRQMRDR
jgi:hypothetical protein